MTMTKSQALTEARRRWGKTATAYTRTYRGEATCFNVGLARLKPFPHIDVRGTNNSFEAAFADADRRTHREED